MLANFLAKSKPINFIIILGLFILYFFIGMFHYFSINDFSLSFTLKQAGLIPLFLILFFLFNLIISKNRLAFDNSYAFLIFVTIIGTFPRTLYDFNNLIINVLLFLFYIYIYSLKQETPFVEKIFNASLLLGVLFIIEPFSGVFIFLIYTALSLFKHLTTRTLLIPLFGLTIPVLFYFLYLFYVDKLQDFKHLFYGYANYNFEIYYTSALWIPICIVALIAIIAFFARIPKILSISGSYRKKAILLLAHFLISFVFLILLKEKNGSELIVTFFPISILIANWTENSKSKKFKNSILSFFVLMPFVFFILLEQGVVVF